jgi:hypothetical protein
MNALINLLRNGKNDGVTQPTTPFRAAWDRTNPASSQVDISRLVTRVVVNQNIKQHLSQTLRLLDELATYKRRSGQMLLNVLNSSSAKQQLELQQLMSIFNEAQTMLSNILKKRDDVASAIAQNIP